MKRAGRGEGARERQGQSRGESQCLRRLTHRVFIKLLVKIN